MTIAQRAYMQVILVQPAEVKAFSIHADGLLWALPKDAVRGIFFLK